MARAPTASFVERENDDPNLAQAEIDLDIAMPGALMASRVPFVEGIDIVEEDDGGVTVDFDPQSEAGDEGDFGRNLAEDLDNGELGATASDLMAQYDSAKESRGDWEQEYSKGLELLASITKSARSHSRAQRASRTHFWPRPPRSSKRRRSTSFCRRKALSGRRSWAS